MIPLLATSALDPKLTIHLGILRGVVVDLEAIVALHVLAVHEVATLAEADPLAVVDLDCLEDGSEDLLGLLFVYSLEQ